MKTKLWAILLMVFVTFLTTLAQIFYKWGVATLKFDFFSIITNYLLITGVVIYAIGAALMILALRGGELSVLYPIIATSYIWVGMLSYFLFREDVSLLRWLGIFAIFFGVVFINIGSKHTEAREGERNEN
jgi:undecaprenyl phosphate-alpha-L-ara4N flippase subunit ArnE